MTVDEKATSRTRARYQRIAPLYDAMETIAEKRYSDVFCSVPDPVLGLNEIARVLKPGGQLLLLEHVRAASPVLGALMDVVNPVAVRMMGANINRRTVENVRHSPLSVTQVEDLDTAGIFKLIIAHKNRAQT